MTASATPSSPDDPTVPRRAGVLLHVASLPGGRLGRGAHRLLDWLADAGFGWWQILPLGPPDRHGSPYAARSAFAASPGFLARPRRRVSAAERDDFRERNAYWIDDWARAAGPRAVDDQVRFDREWAELRAHAADRGVRILGDVPYYVAPGAADVAAHPRLFRHDAVAGVPPDDFSADGQLWGNPPYDWPAMRRDGYRWWIERLRRARELWECSRIDHFRGFVAWWAVPRRARTARRGRWMPGPGAAVIAAARRELGPLPMVAEDLGVITPPVERLRDRLGLPGIRVLQHAFAGGARNPHRLENHPRRAMAVTGTHDNDTVRGWWEAAADEVRARARAAAAEAGLDEREPHRMLVRLALSSRAGLCVVPAQDLLGLGSAARLNTPGTADGNWRWRLPARALTADLARWCHEALGASGRLAR